MSTESESNDLDRDVDASMRMFEKSKVGDAPTISPLTPAKVLLVLDGSTQDATSVKAANHLQGRFQTETLILDARDQTQDNPNDLAADQATAIPGSTAMVRPEGDSYDAILQTISENQPDLLIVPCPFGRSFEHVGVDSAGTAIDVLLSRCPVPILVVRREDQLLSECVQSVSMVVGGECEMESKAAAWLFGLAGNGADVALNLVVEKEQFENIRSILQAIDPSAKLDPEQFSDALAKTHQSLHAAMAKTATSRGLTYALKPVAGEVAPPNSLDSDERMLLVLPLEVDDRFEQGFVHDRIRRSPHPVLVVPGHVAS